MLSPGTALSRGEGWNLPALPELHSTVLIAVTADLEVSAPSVKLQAAPEPEPAWWKCGGGGGCVHPVTHKFSLKSSQKANLSQN